MAKRGQPTKYRKKFIKMVDQYLLECVDKEVGALKRQNEKKENRIYESKLAVNLPSIDGFARYINIARRTLYLWKDKYEDFAFALEKIEIEQKTRAINEGLSGNYNSTIAKLILSTNHGMKDRIDETTGDKPINTFSDAQIDRIAERITSRKGRVSGTSSAK